MVGVNGDSRPSSAIGNATFTHSLDVVFIFVVGPVAARDAGSMFRTSLRTDLALGSERLLDPNGP